MPSKSRPDRPGHGPQEAEREPLRPRHRPPLNPSTASALQALRYLGGYPAPLLQQVQGLIDAGKLGETLRQRHPTLHEVRTDKALYDFVTEIKAQHMRGGEPISKVAYDSKIKVIQHALGTHTRISRVQGGQLKAKREIRVATVFRDAPPDFLRMIVVHELAHLKEREHDKAFYALCQHMQPGYHQAEFDCRLWLTARAVGQWAGPADEA
jgi:UTP pyrophosphatase